MTPVQHPVSGTLLTFALAGERETVRQELASRPGHAARTLAKQGALRLVLVGVSAGGRIRPHTANGPISVHVLEGDIVFETTERSNALGPGDLLVLDGGVQHSVRSEHGGLFLLTLASAPA